MKSQELLYACRIGFYTGLIRPHRFPDKPIPKKYSNLINTFRCRLRIFIQQKIVNVEVDISTVFFLQSLWINRYPISMTRNYPEASYSLPGLNCTRVRIRYTCS